MPIRIAIVGYGKIAKDQHVPSIAADPRFELAAVVSPRAPADEGVPVFPSHRGDARRRWPAKLDAVAICTPPTVRLDVAAAAFDAGLAVLLEKPPAATLGEIEEMERLGARGGADPLHRLAFAACRAGVAGAKAALAGKAVRSLDIVWHEDVRKWHPGQEWIWAPGGFGVFDPGINALSIATRILPSRLFVREATLAFPENRQTPIAARIGFQGEPAASGPTWTGATPRASAGRSGWRRRTGRWSSCSTAAPA